MVSSCVCVCVLVSKKTKQNVLQHADIRWFVLMWYLCLSKSEAPHGATQGKHMFPQGDHLTFQQKATLCPKKTSRWLVFTASGPCARPLLDAWNVCAVNLNRITTGIYVAYTCWGPVELFLIRFDKHKITYIKSAGGRAPNSPAPQRPPPSWRVLRKMSKFITIYNNLTQFMKKKFFALYGTWEALDSIKMMAYS